MTPEERAEKIASDYADRYDLERLIAAAIRDAVAAQQEADAQIAEACHAAAPTPQWSAAQRAIAREIREGER